MKVAFDVDGVVVDIQPKIIRVINEQLGRSLQVSDIDQWDYKVTVGHKASRIAWAVIDSPTLYDDLYADAGALAAIKRLKDSGHDVIFVTSATAGHASSKLRFLTSRKCNSIPLRDIYFAHDKGAIDFDYLIDDRTSTVESLRGRAILWDQPWNRNDAKKTTPRLKSWEELVTVVNQLARVVRPGPSDSELSQAIVDGDESITLEADRLVNGDRQSDYGHPIDDFTKTALMWTGLFKEKLALGEQFTAADVPQAMIAVKLSRLQHRLKRDSIVDVAGYAATLDLVRTEMKKREHSQLESRS